MKHSIYRVTNFSIEAPLTLRVHFDDGKQQLIDFQPVLRGRLFGPLQAVEMFNQVRIDPEVHTWYGQTAQTSIQRHFMIGQNK